MTLARKPSNTEQVDRVHFKAALSERDAWKRIAQERGSWEAHVSAFMYGLIAGLLFGWFGWAA